MAYTNPFKIASGLVLDFTLDSANADNDLFLGRNSAGDVTSFSSIKASRISSGGNVTEATSSVLSFSAGATGGVLADFTIEVAQADAATDGYLSSTDWNTFNNKLGTSLTDSYIFVGSGAGAAVGVPVSGDIGIANDGTVSISSGVIVNADVNANAAIAYTKLAALTASRALVSNGSGFIVVEPSGVTATEVGYLLGLSQSVQSSLTSLGQTIVTLSTNAIVQAPTATQDGYAIVWDEGNAEWTLGPVGAGGSVTGPGSSTDNAMVRWNGLDGTSIQNSGVVLDDTNNMTGVTSITLGQGGLHIFDTGDDHDLIIASGEDLTADHTLTLVLGDSDRTVTLSGSPTLGDWFDQSVKAAASVVFADVTVSNAGGLHLLDSDESHDLIIRTTSDLTADRQLIFVTGDATRTLTINASGTVYVTGGTDVSVADGGTGVSAISALSIWVANSANTIAEVTPGAGNSIRINAGGTAWEAYTPSGGGIGGSTGSVDNSILRADGVGGSTLQSSSLTISDTGNLVLGIGLSETAYNLDVISSGSTADFRIRSQTASNPIQFYVNGSSNSLGMTDGSLLFDWVFTGGEIHVAGASGPLLLESQTHKFTISCYSDIYVDPSDGSTGNIGFFTTSIADWKSMDKGFYIGNAVAEPTAAPTDGVWLWAYDVSSSSELKVMDEAGNTTVLSPHNWDLIGSPSEEMAWSYRSERIFGDRKKRINVDMLAVVREVEKIVGRKLVYEDEIAA